ncbi:dTMP kinase [Thalassotalea mangrovi]|uniref:Thymidylate kinase n=1 Tax=Thalassotalea mangrovi TaxID=2572245 RepID=A0A4U1B6A9_9GAMM|nr:dTMP kinase [Thalassotalea mangrovi]TKB45895.1 dTMP kinase [Thalassotalea mangrovi]
MSQQGKFIVIEGIEGAGKSSAIAVVENTLRDAHIDYIKTREPGGTPLAESLRSLVKSPDLDETLTPECELLLMYASRSQLLHNVIKPALQDGRWVIGDRHDLSSRAYQGGGREIDDKILESLADITLQGFTPDLTFYLDIDPEIGLQRAANRGELDRIEQEKIEFFYRVRDKYLSFANQDEKIVIIDASQPMTVVHEQIEQRLRQYLRDNG